MRKLIYRLLIVIEHRGGDGANVLEPSLFPFCNGERRIVKAVH